MAKNVEIIAREVVRLGLADGTKVSKALAEGKALPFMPAYAWKALGYSVKADQWDNACFTVKLFRNIRGRMCMANTRIFSHKQVEKTAEAQTEAPKVIKEAKQETRKAEPKQTEAPAKKSWKPLSAKEELAKGWKPHANTVKTEAPKVTESKKETRKAEPKNESKVIKAKGTRKAKTRKAPVLKQNVYVENGVEIVKLAQMNGANRIVKETSIPKIVYDRLSKKEKKALESMVMA